MLGFSHVVLVAVEGVLGEDFHALVSPLQTDLLLLLDLLDLHLLILADVSGCLLSYLLVLHFLEGAPV